MAFLFLQCFCSTRSPKPKQLPFSLYFSNISVTDNLDMVIEEGGGIPCIMACNFFKSTSSSSGSASPDTNPETQKALGEQEEAICVPKIKELF